MPKRVRNKLDSDLETEDISLTDGIILEMEEQ